MLWGTTTETWKAGRKLALTSQPPGPQFPVATYLTLTQTLSRDSVILAVQIWKLRLKEAIRLGGDKARTWPQAHALFIYLTCKNSGAGLPHIWLKGLRQVTEPLCASVSSFEVGLRTVAASKGCCEDSQNSCIETLRCGRYMHAWHLARAVIMITLAQVKVARVGVWKRGGSVLANYPMLRPPNCPEIWHLQGLLCCCIFLDSTPLLQDLGSGLPALHLFPVSFTPEHEPGKPWWIQLPNLPLNIYADWSKFLKIAKAWFLHL